jgi:hypothetical protein
MELKEKINGNWSYQLINIHWALPYLFSFVGISFSHQLLKFSMIITKRNNLVRRSPLTFYMVCR